ncbi:MAG: hypothetical protein JWM96_763 [Alphaproteobacteria bacterium]|nr:hypothetical protein [Alphaproteobacteria bacterium]
MTFNKMAVLALTATTLMAFSPSAKALMVEDTETFVKMATISNMFEIESSKVALQKSKNPQVKKFAQQMITDHTNAAAKMKLSLMKAKYDMSAVPVKLDQKHADMLMDLEKDSAADFDEDYVEAQVKAHDEAVTLFTDYAEDGDNTILKTFAASTLPVLKMHQEHVDAMDRAK